MRDCQRSQDRRWALSIDELPLIDKAVLSSTADAFVNTHDFKFIGIYYDPGEISELPAGNEELMDGDSQA